MKAQKIEDVEFKVDRTSEGIDVQLHWKQGEMYLAVCNVLLTDGETWYEVPVKELDHIDIVSEDPLQLRFQLELLDVTVTGKRAERLLALRHFLLPYVKKDVADIKCRSFLKFWSLGMRDRSLLMLMDSKDDTIEDLRKKAIEKGFITEDGELTDKGLDLFGEEDRKHLMRGGS